MEEIKNKCEQSLLTDCSHLFFYCWSAYVVLYNIK